MSQQPSNFEPYENSRPWPIHLIPLFLLCTIYPIHVVLASYKKIKWSQSWTSKSAARACTRPLDWGSRSSWPLALRCSSPHPSCPEPRHVHPSLSSSSSCSLLTRSRDRSSASGWGGCTGVRARYTVRGTGVSPGPAPGVSLGRPGAPRLAG